MLAHGSVGMPDMATTGGLNALTLLLVLGAVCLALAAIGAVVRPIWRLARKAEWVAGEADKVASVSGEVQQLARVCATLGDRLDYLSNRPLMNGSGDRAIAQLARIDEWIGEHSQMHDLLAQVPPQWRPRHDHNAASEE